ncbi:MAG: hypothetical protein PHY95_03550 [Candidatus ainarchaeum sp.]|nr:hypothetical protein [Candidatus ainarchaeum sp.]
MRFAALLAFGAFLLVLAGCASTIKNEEASCSANRTATPCTNAALWYAVLHKDVGSALSMCAQIDASGADAFVGSGRDRCYMEVARAAQDVSICNNIDPLNMVTKGLCIDRAKPARASTFCIPALVLPALALVLFVRRR